MNDKELTLDQAQAYAILAMKRAMEKGDISRSVEDNCRAIDYYMFDIALSDQVMPEQAEEMVKGLGWIF